MSGTDSGRLEDERVEEQEKERKELSFPLETDWSHSDFKVLPLAHSSLYGYEF